MREVASIALQGKMVHHQHEFEFCSAIASALILSR